eukprot:TRINITY_DN3209_c0_g2_i1.p1 TRINITY_DN3209_c0_g2~~TRINITY_DN3209_c0_g2_i1.p1  ORF type:complete len:640 (-),score=145.07 TRINITY_DN3209_c0_g2_i1:153-2072(-)
MALGLSSSRVLSSTRLFGDVAQDMGRNRGDLSKPRNLTADQLLSAGPKGGPGSPQDKRHKRILLNQDVLINAAAHVVENPRKLYKALGPKGDLDVSAHVMSDVQTRLGRVVVDRVDHAFLETSLASSRSPMRKDRLSKLRQEVSWARTFKDRCDDELQGQLLRVEISAEALAAVEKAQELQDEAQARAMLDAVNEATALPPISPAGASANGGMGKPQLKRLASKKMVDSMRRVSSSPALTQAALPRPAEVIVCEAMQMLRQWKEHEEVALALCNALLAMAEVCGEEFQEEMGRKGLGVLASTVADMWKNKTQVCRASLRLLSVSSIELLIAMMVEQVENSIMITTLGLEALNMVAKQGQTKTDEIALYGGRELIAEVEQNFASNEMVNLLVVNLKRRLRKSKVKSIIPKPEVQMPAGDVVRIRGCFEAIDKDGTGQIGEEGLWLAFAMLGMKLNQRELREAFTSVDTDGSGSIEWPEFLFLMAQFGAESSLESKFTQERLDELREVFAIFDEDGSGSLEAEELAVVMRSLGMTPTQEEIERMIDEVDADGSGAIEWPEFLTLMSKQCIKPDEQHKFAFEFFDKGREGKIQKSDFIEQMRMLSKDFTEEELEEMFAEAKFEDGDSEQLTYKEFVKMMMRT